MANQTPIIVACHVRRVRLVCLPMALFLSLALLGTVALKLARCHEMETTVRWYHSFAFSGGWERPGER